jgi:NADH-quinone oxidoreductase subunit M
MAFFAAIGVVLGACYMLWLYKRVWFSEITNEEVKKLAPLNVYEFSSLAAMAVLVIIFGIKPNLLLDYFNILVNNLVSIYK